ncbi:[FeFe] hydrogenase H-cluster radical SAM maturase HydE [Anaerosporobacter faecicola]|uniref:[FeFe] hydrogenase H-cluster radical SAM maturase HydE n=1 Tax=Anaerosporobacter faecicola TaxID=2718714 RepID=UPI00143B3472|nr:[FeFe] hydrogenase H-cluster radical SAM maturase HydE [Anaerosporobacter faecicola]
MKEIIDRLADVHTLSREEYRTLLTEMTAENEEYLALKAREIRHAIYGHDVFTRGLIEFTNYCKNDCYYCGIRKSNQHASRYRLTREEILSCCKNGYELGFRTFVLQGGEDGYYTDERLVQLVRIIHERYPDCAITLSIGERSKESYQRLYDAGASRYLLRHETANEAHYKRLHPSNLSLQNRKACLVHLKNIGYQVGCGFMVGSPGQTVDNLIEDLNYISSLQPHMVGIGPFIPHKDTSFANEKAGSLAMTLRLLSILRLMLPSVLLPATTALGTIHPMGREKGILAGANVVMPNLSPTDVRKKYMLYDNKICTGDEAAECRLCLSRRMEKIGYRLVVDRGDYRTCDL